MKYTVYIFSLIFIIINRYLYLYFILCSYLYLCLSPSPDHPAEDRQQPVRQRIP